MQSLEASRDWTVALDRVWGRLSRAGYMRVELQTKVPVCEWNVKQKRECKMTSSASAHERRGLTFNSKMGPRHSLVGEMKNAENTTSKVIIKSCGWEKERDHRGQVWAAAKSQILPRRLPCLPNLHVSLDQRSCRIQQARGSKNVWFASWWSVHERARN